MYTYNEIETKNGHFIYLIVLASPIELEVNKFDTLKLVFSSLDHIPKDRIFYSREVLETLI